MELVNGKTDVVVIDKATAQKSILPTIPSLKSLRIMTLSAMNSMQSLLAKGNTELLNKINEAIDKLIADGTVNELAAKYAVSEE